MISNVLPKPSLFHGGEQFRLNSLVRWSSRWHWIAFPVPCELFCNFNKFIPSIWSMVKPFQLQICDLDFFKPQMNKVFVGIFFCSSRLVGVLLKSCALEYFLIPFESISISRSIWIIRLPLGMWIVEWWMFSRNPWSQDSRGRNCIATGRGMSSGWFGVERLSLGVWSSTVRRIASYPQAEGWLDLRWSCGVEWLLGGYIDQCFITVFCLADWSAGWRGPNEEDRSTTHDPAVCTAMDTRHCHCSGVDVHFAAAPHRWRLSNLETPWHCGLADGLPMCHCDRSTFSNDMCNCCSGLSWVADKTAWDNREIAPYLFDRIGQDRNPY